jgi:NAD(P)-dependent dehydrogenase (short-subunit alcohol dehydrogenase family)
MSREPNRFDGAVALVTGASKGIGHAIAAQLASEGAAVMLNARSPEELAKAENAIGESGGKVASIAASVVDEDGAEEIVAATAETFGSIDHIVNVVGVNAFHGPLLEISRGKFERTMVGNTWPLIALVRAGLEDGLDSGGSVVGVSSIGARQVQPLLAHYSAAKLALESLIRHLARDLGPLGVRVNGVAPGLVATDMSRVLWEGPTGGAESAMLPMQRLGQPQDIADATCFLLSSEADWLTGMTIDVDGGRMLVGGEPRELIGNYETGR